MASISTTNTGSSSTIYSSAGETAEDRAENSEVAQKQESDSDAGYVEEFITDGDTPFDMMQSTVRNVEQLEAVEERYAPRATGVSRLTQRKRS